MYADPATWRKNAELCFTRVVLRFEYLECGLSFISVWLSNCIHYKLWDELTYLFPNFNGFAVEVWEWINHFIPQFRMDIIAYLLLSDTNPAPVTPTYCEHPPPPLFFNLFLLEPSYMGLLLESGMAGLLDHLTFVGHWLHPTGVSLWITSQDVSTWSAGTITYCKVIWQCWWAAVWIWNHFTVL